MARRPLFSSLAAFFIAVAFVVFAPPMLDTAAVQANDGTGLDKVTWSGTIRIEKQIHRTESSTNGTATSTLTDEGVEVSEYQLHRIFHETRLNWGSSDVLVQVRGSETVTSRHVDTAPVWPSEYNSQDVHNGSGNTTAGVLLVLRGASGTGKDTCWLETSSIGERDDGGPTTKPIDYPGTSHSWGVGGGHPYDVTESRPAKITPQEVRTNIPCPKDAHSLIGSKELENSNGVVERVTYSLHQDGNEPQTEVELVPPGGYEDWRPQAGENEKTVGNWIQVGVVAHTQGDPSLKPPKKVLKYSITLEGTSKEKGVDCNWPKRDKATADLDMKIDPGNALVKVTDDNGQAAEVNQEDVTAFQVRINSYDWGGYTKLKVIAELEGGDAVVAHVRGHSDQESLAIPLDDNLNHIADGWEHQWSVENTDPSADDDDYPPGDNHNGDSIALYDEYRGFHIGGKHEGLSPNRKDLFVVDYEKLGAGLYPQATGVCVHLVTEDEVLLKGGLLAVMQGQDPPNLVVINPNSGQNEAYGIFLEKRTLDAGIIGTTQGGPSVPKDIRRVDIDSAKILSLDRRNNQTILVATIAHELGHATNVRHHGEMPPDYKIQEGRCTLPDGTTKDYKGPPDGRGLTVATQGGLFSGNDTCLMRYFSATFYEKEKGNCWWQHDGKTVHGFAYGVDPPGGGLCQDDKGTGVNDPKGLDKAGNASLGRGKCIAKYCLKNSAH